MAEKWIQKMHLKKGALHEEMHVAKDKKIPKEKLEKAAKKGGKEGKRAELAITLEKMPHGKKKKHDCPSCNH